MEIPARTRPLTDLAGRLAASLADRYRLERELGRGGMAVVYRAHDIRHDRPVAIKVLRPELAASLGADRFLREIRFAARLQHPHILPLLDSGEVAAEGGAGPPVLWYAMPLVEGESLRDRLRRHGQQPLADVLRWTAEVADALAYAHAQGVVHRDIKPENVLLSAAGAEPGVPPHALLADFGVARALETSASDRLTETGLALGTPTYMSAALHRPHRTGDRGQAPGRSDPLRPPAARVGPAGARSRAPAAPGQVAGRPLCQRGRAVHGARRAAGVGTPVADADRPVGRDRPAPPRSWSEPCCSSPWSERSWP